VSEEGEGRRPKKRNKQLRKDPKGGENEGKGRGSQTLHQGKPNSRGSQSRGVKDGNKEKALSPSRMKLEKKLPERRT